MKRLSFFALAMIFSLHLLASSFFSVYEPTCEQEENPIGIDNSTPCFSWKIHSKTRGFIQKAYQIRVADSKEKLVVRKGYLWDSGKVDSPESVLIPFQGKDLKSGTTYYWSVRCWDNSGKVSEWSIPQSFTMGLLNASDWQGAEWISLEADEAQLRRVPALLPGRDQLPEKQFKNPQFRKEFVSGKAIKKAIASVSGLGHFEFFLNGSKVGTNFLDPGWTKYDKSVLYVTFDVTSLLNNGANVIGVMLGGGFYQIPPTRYLKIYNGFGAPKLKMHLQLEYTDGTRECIVSDRSWKTTESPIVFSSIYGGEDYNAALEQEGWMHSGFDDCAWKTPFVAQNEVAMYAQRSTPLHVRDQMPVVRSWKTSTGKWVYDFGQNFSGIVRIKVKGERKKTIKFHPSELLNSDSTVNQYSSGGPFWFAYSLKGSEVEEWQPQFTYYGFRYVELEGAVPVGADNPGNLPEILEIKGLHTTNSAPEAGSFTCSKPLFNKTHELIDWAMRSNMASILTDCPHREKLGWLEEAYLMQYSLQYRYNLSRLYEKILADMAQAQTENGVIPTIAPEYVRFDSGFEDTPEWGSAFILCPWNLYQWYGDTRFIVKYYPQMKRYLEYLTSRANDHIVAYGLGDWYDLGPNPPGYSQLTSNGVTATATYYYNTIVLQQMAALLGNTEDEKLYGELAAKIKESFNRHFFHKDKQCYDRNSQTANAIAIAINLVEPAYKMGVLNNLIFDIRQRGNALTAGDVGYGYLLKALGKNGCQEIIYDMNSQYDVPGYGYQLAEGATSLTESWKASRSSSNNHFMLGHLMEWLYSGLGGIRQQEGSVAYKKILIDPQVVGDLREARTCYESPYGTIRCEWRKEHGAFFIKVEIPENSEALVLLPVYSVEGVTENGVSLAACKDITVIGQEGNKLKVKIGSGNYSFKM